MKKLIASLLLLTLSPSVLATDQKLSALPLGNASTVGSNDSFPYVDATTSVTKRLKLSDLANVPIISSTFAPKANPTFTGTLTAPAILGNVTGNITGNVTGNLTGNVTGNVTGDTAGTHTGPVVGAVTGNVTGNTAGTHTGAVVGNVTGNVTGDLTGNSSGTHTGPVIGAVTGNVTGNTSGTHTGAVVGNVTGDLTGNSSGTHTGAVSGNVTGNLTGNVTGNVTGDLTGNVTGNTSGTHSGPVTGTVTGSLVGNASTATALAANPSDCGAGTKATAIDASGNLTCSAASLTADVSGTLPIANGGTGQTAKAAAFDALSPNTTTGDLTYHNGTNNVRLAVGSTNQVLKVVAGAPSWGSVVGGGGFDLANQATDGDAESNTIAGFTSSTTGMAGSDFAVTSTAGKVFDGTYSYKFDAAQSGNYVQRCYSAPDPIVGRNAFLYFVYHGGDSNLSVAATNGTNNLGDPAVTLAATSASQTWRITKVAFTGPTSGNICMKLLASGNAAEADFEFFFGRNFDLGTVQNITAWQSFTPTGTWTTNATYTGKWRQVGDSMEVMATVSLSGAPSAGDLYIRIPTGYTIDASKIPTSNDGEASLGVVNIKDTGTRQFSGSVFYGSSGYVWVGHTESANNGYTNPTNPMTFASGDSVSVRFTVPITGWNSETALRIDQTPMAPTVQTFAASGTYTKPANVSWVRVRAVGGGGGGGGGKNGAGGAGGSTSFGSLITAGGSGATSSFSTAGVGGTGSLGTGASGSCWSGGQGQDGETASAAVTNMYTSLGGSGASSPLGGAGGGGSQTGFGPGASARANTGSGGGGGGLNGATTSSSSGAGGGAGAYCDAVVSSAYLSSPITVTVGAAGSHGVNSGGGGYNGGDGGSGYVEVTEYYGQMNMPVIVGTVATSSTGQERVERVTVSACSSSPCTMLSNTPGITSVTWVSTGVYNINFATGLFTSAPTCTGTTTNYMTSKNTATTTSAYQLLAINLSGTASNSAFDVVCVGPK